MSVILHQLDSNISIVTVVVVDRFGELVQHVNFQKLMPPRKFKPRDNIQSLSEEDQQRAMKQQQSHGDEVKEHEADKERVIQLIQKHDVDLIVVGANKLEARLIKNTLVDISEKLKSYGGRESNNDNKRGGNEDYSSREVSVIWGSLEVPKLFSNSNASQKLLKQADPILKQAVSLARFEQDPMNEILNLWSFLVQENQAL